MPEIPSKVDHTLNEENKADSEGNPTLPDAKQSLAELGKGLKELYRLRFRQTLTKVNESLQLQGVDIVKVITNAGVFNLGDSRLGSIQEEAFLEAVFEKGRPYWVFEGETSGGETVLAKVKISDKDPMHTGNNEIHFFRSLSGPLNSNMPQELKGKIRVPQHIYSQIVEKPAYDNPEGFSFLITEFATGEVMSPHFYEAQQHLSMDQFRALIKFLRYFQDTLTPDLVAQGVPELEQNDVGGVSTFAMHETRFNRHRTDIVSMLGEEYAERMRQLLADKKEFLENAQKVFINQDVNPANLIRGNNGELCIVDWERLKVVPNIAAAFNHIIEAHWANSDLYHAMIQETLAQNSDLPDFRELMRLDFIFYKYTFNYINIAKNPNVSPEARAHAQAGLEKLSEYLKEAIDETGVWAK